MIKLDDDFLASLGLAGMSTDDKKAFLQHIYEELELRVGVELSKGLTDQQLEEFGTIMDSGDQAESLKWLETNCPNYKDVVASELEKLKQEIISNKDQLVTDPPKGA
ncbi:MAG TPA: DUF5663 domain-containing protein [Patescibacteria group bacterium]|jgi:hypothetical protein|nr:DUF5663 domain-containing protein [Patescibacteria group bacterium]